MMAVDSVGETADSSVAMRVERKVCEKAGWKAVALDQLTVAWTVEC